MIREIVASPNARAKCRRCRKSIEKGEARAAREEDGMFGEPVSAYYHALCVVDVAVDEVAAFLNARSIAEFPGHEEIRAVVARRARAIEEARKEPAARDASAMVVEGARDPAGRPRVRVYLAGSAFSMGNGPWFDFERVARDLTWRSPLREYQFVLQFTGIADPPDDPSQPVIGAVFAPYADGKAMPNQRQKVSAWKSKGLRTPVLWIFARGTDRVPTDEQVQRWRGFLEEAGYSGDESVVCSARAVDEASLDALVAALDESFAIETSSEPVAASAVGADLRLAAKIDELLASGMAVAAHHELVTASSALRHAGKDGALTAFWSSQCEGLKRVTDEGRRAFCVAATNALAFDECVESALYVLDSTPDHDANAAMVAALGRLVRDPKQKVNKLVKALVRAMAQRSTPGRARPLLDALPASSAARAKSLADVLFDLRDDEGDRALVAWIDGLDDRDPRKSALGEARSRFKQRIARKAR
ncbi:MAG: hypothetical protein U0269_20175 [Polyangiales bacterium]